jgi:hypothetical protein
MNFDIESIKQAISAFGVAVTALKQAKDLLPQNSKKQELNIVIETAEKQMKIAELELAKALGHEVCTNHWPSGIMLSTDKKNWECPICGNEIKPIEPQQPKHPASGIKGI